ncbi:hypothetical protein TCAL_07969 [Tigriopus californicus]|uniref:Uncharacterized protein n=1 Tax=Tigriopus californicus TaxID=6832 RepID=A0A553N6V1_TIGCA|nr:hypothetical protein TCAL_07969 [Tigriopus californicus]
MSGRGEGSSNAFLGCSQDLFHRNLRDHVQSAGFCTHDNWKSAVIGLGQELELHGFLSPCANDDTGQGNLDIISLINTTWELLCHHRNAMKTISDLETQMQRLHCDVDQFHTSALRQRELLEAKSRQLHEVTERDRRTHLILDEEKLRLKNLKEEMKRLSNLMIQRDAQYRHEMKRKDLDVCKLKDKLMKVLTDKSGNNVLPMGIEIASLVSKSVGKSRGRWKASEKNDGEILHKVCDDYEAKLEVLRDENIQLREVLYRNLSSMFQACVEAQGQTKDSQCQFVNLPLSLGCKRIDEISREVVQGIQNRLKIGFDCSTNKRTADQAAIAGLQNELQQFLESNSSKLADQATDLEEALSKALTFLQGFQSLLSTLDQERTSLQTEQRKLECVRKKLLASLVPMLDECGLPSTWEIEDGPSWSSHAIATNEQNQAGPVSIGPQYCPQAVHRVALVHAHTADPKVSLESKAFRSPNGVVMREHTAGQNSVGNGVRPRSANMSPQRWTVVSPTGTLSNSPAMESSQKSRQGRAPPPQQERGKHLLKEQA